MALSSELAHAAASMAIDDDSPRLHHSSFMEPSLPEGIGVGRNAIRELMLLSSDCSLSETSVRRRPKDTTKRRSDAISVLATALVGKDAQAVLQASASWQDGDGPPSTDSDDDEAPSRGTSWSGDGGSRDASFNKKLTSSRRVSGDDGMDC